MSLFSFKLKLFTRLSIKKKMILTIMGITTFILLTSLSIFITNELLNLKQTMLEDLAALSDLIGNDNTGTLMFYDSRAANESLLVLKAKPHITRAMLFQENATQFAAYNAKKSGAIKNVPHEVYTLLNEKKEGYFYLNDLIHMVKPIVFKQDNSTIGFIYMVSDRTVYWENVRKYIYTIVIMMLLALILAFLFAYRAQSIFTSPIFKLLNSMNEVSRDKNYAATIKEQYDDEFGELIQGYNQMLYELEQHHLVSRNYQKDLEQRVEERTRELEQARDKALTASRTKSIFLANMSHEIRTPMNAILGYSQLLQQSTLDADQYRQLGVIDKSGKHLLSLINSILELSKIESGRLDINHSDFDLTDLVYNIESMFKIQCQQKKIDLIIDCYSSNPIKVNGDQGKLRQILINLIGNACKFTEQGEILLKIEQIEAETYQFMVKDTGAGIEESALERIFDAFHQEENGHQKGGTGLGLNITKRYIELLGGNLQVKSEVNKGSIFTFQLPFLAASSAFQNQQKLPNTVIRLKSGKQLTALVVDDISDNSELLNLILTKIGFQVVCATNGLEALAEIEKKCPDIVFMDIRMPVMDGLEAIKKIRENYSPDELKCIAVSASNMRHQANDFISRGYNLFISKPFHFDSIYYAITQILGEELQISEQRPTSDIAPITAQKSVAKPVPSAVHSLILDQDFVQELKQAAEYGQLTKLGNMITRIKNYGPEAENMAQHLELLVNSADLDSILEYVENLNDEQYSTN